MWRDGLTVIALGSSVENRAPDYLTLDQATADAALDIHEAPAQTVPTVEAVTGKAGVLILGGDTIIGGAQNRIRVDEVRVSDGLPREARKEGRGTKATGSASGALASRTNTVRGQRKPWVPRTPSPLTT
jgi:hypothetical protein